jgi:secreted trypsin-like serine protease
MPARSSRCFVRPLLTALAVWLPSLPSAAQECRSGPDEPRPKIVGGNTAQLRNWPGQALLRLYSKSAKNALYSCGGTAIGERWVLTAAHCVADINAELKGEFSYGKGKLALGTLEVVLGVADLDAVREDNIFQIDKVIIRDGYKDAAQTGQDIALVHLKRAYNGPVVRLSLNRDTDPQTPPGAQVRVAGFGSMNAMSTANSYRSPDGQEYLAGSRKLMETAVPTVAGSVCKARYQSSKIDDEQLCAGLEEGGKDSCQGDSGGPLVSYDRHGCPFQVGVVSWGVGCAGAHDYGIYTRVSYHADWLTSVAGSLKAVTANDLQQSKEDTVRSELSLQARSQLEEVLAAAQGRVRIGVKSGNRVAVGSEVVLTVQSDVPGRLIVIDMNAAGEVLQILPNKYTAADSVARVAAGTNLTVPGPGYGFTAFQAVEPLGKGQLIALVVPETFPIASLIGDKVHMAKGFEPVQAPTSYLMNLVQQVVVAAGGRSSGDAQMKGWGLGAADYEIVR